MKTTVQVVVGVVVAAAICVGAWFGYWALARQNTTEQYKVNTNNQQYQGGLVSQERDRIAAYDVATDPSQKAQIKATFCQVFPTLNPAPQDLILANARICS